MPISDYLRKKHVKDVLSSTYLALSSTPIQPDGTGLTEPEGNGYARKSVSGLFPTEPSYDQENDKFYLANNANIYFEEARGAWGTLGYFAVVYGNNIVAYGTLTNAIAPTAGTIPVIRTGDLVVTE